MLNLTNYFCGFSWENGAHKRYFKLNENGHIEDLFGSKGHDNERFWHIDGDKLILTSKDNQPTSQFTVVETGSFFFILQGSTSVNPSVTLRLFCAKKQSDLFEAKAKFINRNAIQKGYLEVGDNTYGKINLIDPEYGKVKIGNYCSLSNPTFIVGYHRSDLVSTFPFKVLNDFYSSQEVTFEDHMTKGIIEVGNDVWIGLNAVIMSGVKIGDGAIIGAHAVVTKNVEPYSIVGGNPAKHIRYRIVDETQRKQMQEIAWWNWSEEKIAENINKITNPNITAFIQEFGKSAKTKKFALWLPR